MFSEASLGTRRISSSTPSSRSFAKAATSLSSTATDADCLSLWVSSLLFVWREMHSWLSPLLITAFRLRNAAIQTAAVPKTPARYSPASPSQSNSLLPETATKSLTPVMTTATVTQQPATSNYLPNKKGHPKGCPFCLVREAGLEPARPQ